MATLLTADFTFAWPGGAEIRFALSMPADKYHIAVLYGPSGCGKSTVLRCLAGLERPQTGRISAGRAWFDAATGVCLSPGERNVGIVFQDYALFPHLSVAENIGYGLRRLPAPERAARVTEALGRFGIAALRDRLPRQISGGQQQRVALARSLVTRPGLLLLDEPFAALDTALRRSLRAEMKTILQDLAIPAVLVTHDEEEAGLLADQLIRMSDGGREDGP